MTLRTLNYGNNGIFLVMGNAGFISSTVGLSLLVAERHEDDDMNPNPKSTILNPRVLYGPSELSLLFWWLLSMVIV